MLIHSARNTEFFFHEGRSNYLLVTFNEIALLADGKSYWGKPMIERENITAIGVVSRKPDWFMPGDDIREFLTRHGDILRGFKGDIVLVGHSMGAFGAIKFSKAFGATTVIASCPIYSLNPAMRGRTDRPDPPFYVEALHKDMHPRREELGGRIYILRDPWHNWRRSFEKYRDIGYDGLSFVDLPFTDHETIKIFARDERFPRLIALARSGDEAPLKAFVRQCRYASSLRLQIVAAHRAIRHPASAYRIWTGNRERFSAPYMLLLSRALAATMPGEAQEIARRMVEVAPGFAPGQKQLAALMGQERQIVDARSPRVT